MAFNNQQVMVALVVGSDTDLPVIQTTTQTLEQLGLNYEITIASAHRSPQRVKSWIENMEARGVEVYIAGAGGAAHLPGMVAAETIKPVIGLPMPTLYLGGQDSLLSIVQMPSGVPVATVAVGKAGATNAAVLAAQIVALKHPEVAERLTRFKEDLRANLEKKAGQLSALGVDQYIETM
jgi:5-(carboxyamino)imidazole ribonucleotide mutase